MTKLFGPGHFGNIVVFTEGVEVAVELLHLLLVVEGCALLDPVLNGIRPSSLTVFQLSVNIIKIKKMRLRKIGTKWYRPKGFRDEHKHLDHISEKLICSDF